MPKIPEKMQCVEIAEFGGPEMLTLVERETPQPGPGEVLVAVAGAGVNRGDLLQRMGHYPPPPGASDLPGLEVSGVVVALGEGVQAPALGEEVCAIVPGGGYAEYCVVAAPVCLPVPQGVSLIEAAGLAETFMTVWTNVFEDAGLQAGETLLVHGGTSGIGVAAIQLAKARGAFAIVTCGTAEKCAAAKELGADIALNYREDDWASAIREAGGVDVVLDIMGGAYVQKNLSCLKPRGRHVSIAVQGGPKAEISMLDIMLKRLRVSGSTLRARPVPQKAAVAEGVQKEVWPLFAEGRLKPMLFKTFPLAEARAAHQLLGESGHVGKLVLTM